MVRNLDGENGDQRSRETDEDVGAETRGMGAPFSLKSDRRPTEESDQHPESNGRQVKRGFRAEGRKLWWHVTIAGHPELPGAPRSMSFFRAADRRRVGCGHWVAGRIGILQPLLEGANALAAAFLLLAQAFDRVARLCVAL